MVLSTLRPHSECHITMSPPLGPAVFASVATDDVKGSASPVRFGDCSGGGVGASTITSDRSAAMAGAGVSRTVSTGSGNGIATPPETEGYRAAGGSSQTSLSSQHPSRLIRSAMPFEEMRAQPVTAMSSSTTGRVEEDLTGSELTGYMLAAAKKFKAHQSAAAALMAVCGLKQVRVSSSPKRPLVESPASFKHSQDAATSIAPPTRECCTSKRVRGDKNNTQGHDLAENELSPKSVLSAPGYSSSSLMGSPMAAQDERLRLPSDVMLQLTHKLLHSDMEPMQHPADRRAFHGEAMNHCSSKWSIWEGMLKHNVDKGRTMEICGLYMPVPIDLIEAFPPTLFVAKLLPKEMIDTSSSDVFVPCTLPHLSKEHGLSLTKMIEVDICVIVNLQDCRVCFVPTMDQQGKLSGTCTFRRFT